VRLPAARQQHAGQARRCPAAHCWDPCGCSGARSSIGGLHHGPCSRKPPTAAGTHRTALQVYSISGSNLCLTGTAEVPLAGVYMDKVLDEAALPLKMAAFGHCFRTEAGAGGAAGGLSRAALPVRSSCLDGSLSGGLAAS
jgi:hypothetical protein